MVVHLVSQDLSVAGKRAGLAGARSGLFMEQCRVVKEMWNGTQTCPTLTANNAHGGQRMPDKENFNGVIEMKTVRRLTPMECERLQGFPDGWTDIGELTDSKGKVHETADSARYKALGNSIAIPFWMWLTEKISAQYDRPVTLGSLFDGIGGFPYCFEAVNGEGSAVWASEIEEFPIAVTKRRFGDGDKPGDWQTFSERKDNKPDKIETVAIEGNGQRESHKGTGYNETDKMYTLNTTEVHGVAYGE